MSGTYLVLSEFTYSFILQSRKYLLDIPYASDTAEFYSLAREVKIKKDMRSCTVLLIREVNE